MTEVVPAEVTPVAVASAHVPIAPAPVHLVPPVVPVTAAPIVAAIWNSGLRINVVLILILHVLRVVRHLEFVLLALRLQSQPVLDLSKRTPVLGIAAMT